MNMKTDLKTVMQEALEVVRANHQWHRDYDDYGGYPSSELETQNIAAIANLTTALAELEKAEPVHQFRRECCSDWYDGLPDETDGRGPYETRTLLTHPAPSAAPQPAQQTRSQYGWDKECDDTDALLAHLGLAPDTCRTDGGWLNLPRIKALLEAKSRETFAGAPASDSYKAGISPQSAWPWAPGASANTPAQPAMVPLSDEQIGGVLANDYESAVDIAHAVIAKFCEVNGIAQPGEPT